MDLHSLRRGDGTSGRDVVVRRRLPSGGGLREVVRHRRRFRHVRQDRARGSASAFLFSAPPVSHVPTNAHISLFPLVPSRRTSSCHPGGACAYFRYGRGCRTGTEPSTAVASPPSWTSSPPWRCSPSPKIRASGTFIFNFRMGNWTDAVFCCSQRQHIYKLRVARAGRDGRRGGRPGDQGGTDARVHGRDVTHEGRRQGGGHRDALQVSAKLADELETLSDR